MLRRSLDYGQYGLLHNYVNSYKTLDESSNPIQTPNQGRLEKNMDWLLNIVLDSPRLS